MFLRIRKKKILIDIRLYRDMTIKKKNITKPYVGDKVKIAIKPYKGKTEIGIVKNVLTKRNFHSRGHKVRLQSGTIGRVLRIIKKK